MRLRHQHKRPPAPLEYLPRLGKQKFDTPGMAANRHIISHLLVKLPDGNYREYSFHATKGYRAMRP